MGVVARMVVSEVTLMGWATKIKLNPQSPQSGQPHEEEIKAFYEATPQGAFEAVIKNDVAAEQFQPGDAFYVTLERIPRDRR
jgi:hypothetical protein